MSFRVRVWCRDCGHGQDPLGCFDGGSKILDGSPSWAERRFETVEDANAAGYEYTDGPPWDFAVEYADGERAGEEIDAEGKEGS